MSVRRRVEVKLVDDSDLNTISVEPRDPADLDDDPVHGIRPWLVFPSGGGTTVFASSADLLEFANQIRELVETDPFRSEPEA